VSSVLSVRGPSRTVVPYYERRKHLCSFETSGNTNKRHGVTCRKTRIPKAAHRTEDRWEGVIYRVLPHAMKAYGEVEV
jgi:hypothetical protein